jgi:hypothetical protein
VWGGGQIASRTHDLSFHSARGMAHGPPSGTASRSQATSPQPVGSAAVTGHFGAK